MPVLVGVVYRILVLYAAGMVLLAWKRGREGPSREDPEMRRGSKFPGIKFYSDEKALP